MHDPDKPEGADDLLAAARRRLHEATEALRRPKHGIRTGSGAPRYISPRGEWYRRSGHDRYRVRDKGDGRAQERLAAAEAKRARRRERNLIAGGVRPPMTSAMWELAGLCWDWYQLPGNDVGGALHVVLDDMNIEDRNLAWCRTESIGVLWADEGRVPAPPEYVAAATAILDGLAVLDDAQRAIVVRMADVYGPTRPKETTDV